MSQTSSTAQLALSSGPGRLLILVTVLGSGMAFLDCTVVPVALPAIVADLGGGIALQQWILNGYLLSLSALLLLGGALGDRYGRRRVFVLGLVAFTVASVGCGLAPSGAALVAARLAQGVGAALLIPGSLALINSTVRVEDRGRAIGAWAGLSGIATALGPLLGGWLVDVASWRLVFLINLPLAVVAVAVTLRRIPQGRSYVRPGGLDLRGTAVIVVGLTGLTYALIEIPHRGWTVATGLAAAAGAASLVAFPLLERRAAAPLLPLELFRSTQFTGANIATFTLEGAVGGAFFLLALHLQESLGYSALAAGLALLPITMLMVLLSSRIGSLAQRTGPRLPMTVGPLACAAGFVLLADVESGSAYWPDIFPAVLTFAVGLTITVAPLTSAVLAAVDDRDTGAASGVNNTIAWVAGLVAVAVLPSAAGIDTAGAGPLGPGFGTAMLISAVACAVGSVVAFATVRRRVPVQARTVPAAWQPCPDAEVRVDADVGSQS